MTSQPGRLALPPQVAALYPFVSNYLDVGGHAYHYLDEGKGEPMVMVHGNPTWSFYYRRLISGLRDRYRLIAPDHIGCGLSAKPDDRSYHFTLAQRVDDLARLIDHLRLERVTLVLHDWGGMIGMAYAVRHPERIARIILANTAAFPQAPGRKLPLSIALCRAPAVGPVLVRGLNAFSLGAAMRCVTRARLAPAVRAGYLAPYNNWANRRAVLRFVQDIPLQPGDASYDLVQEVGAHLTTLRSLPMLILWGARDFVFDDRFLSEWVARFPNATVARYPDVGHYLFEEAAEDVLPVIRKFMLTPGGRAAH